MVKFDVHPLKSGDGFVLDVQAELLDHLNTRIVVPLIPRNKAPKPAQRLNPVFEIDDQQYVMMSQYLSAVLKSELGSPVANLSGEFTEITNALDIVFHGF